MSLLYVLFKIVTFICGTQEDVWVPRPIWRLMEKRKILSGIPGYRD
jgi:hypothetical protein